MKNKNGSKIEYDLEDLISIIIENEKTERLEALSSSIDIEKEWEKLLARLKNNEKK